MHIRSRGQSTASLPTHRTTYRKGQSVNRFRISTLAIAALVAVLAACGGPTPTPDPDPNQATLTVNTTGNGTVAVDGTTYTDPMDVALDSEVVLTATADAGWTFSGWGGACEGAGAACTVTMDGDKTVTATFTQVDPNARTVTVNTAGTGTGSVSVNGEAYSGPVTVETGSTATIVATAAGDSTFAGWTGACEGQAETCELTVDENVTTTATFDLANSNANRVEKRIGTTADGTYGNDGEQFLQASSAGGSYGEQFVVSTSTRELEITYSSKFDTDQAIGLRFTDLDIPQGATITRAWIEFTAFTNAGDGTAVNLTLVGEKAHNPAQFPDGQVLSGPNFPDRPKTEASVQWKITDAWAPDQVYSSADIQAIVQEIVSMEGWTPGSSDVAVYLMNDESDPNDPAATQAASGVRIAYDSKGDATKAARLVVEYEEAGATE